MSKVGYFGGTFDPIHNGHMNIAKCVVNFLSLDKLYFLPNNNQPFKEKGLDYNIRCDMIRLAINGYKKFDISYVENENRIHYTIDTIKLLYNKNDKIYFIIGEDSLDSLDSWKSVDEIFEYTKIAVVPRSSKYNELKEKCRIYSIEYDTDIIAIDMPIYDISSSQIREFIRQNKSINDFVPNEVERYILGRKIYEC